MTEPQALTKRAEILNDFARRWYGHRDGYFDFLSSVMSAFPQGSAVSNAAWAMALHAPIYFLSGFLGDDEPKRIMQPTPSAAAVAMRDNAVRDDAATLSPETVEAVANYAEERFDLLWEFLNFLPEFYPSPDVWVAGALERLSENFNETRKFRAVFARATREEAA